MGTGGAAAFFAVILPHHRFQPYHRQINYPCKGHHSPSLGGDCCPRFRCDEALCCVEFTLIYWQG
jgi:hypothetical protein